MAETGITWGIHAGPSGEAVPLFKKGYIALGWHELGDLALLPPNREAFKQRVAEEYPDYKPGAIPVTAGQLYRFVHEAKPGELVVYRSKTDKAIWIGRIAGPYHHDSGVDPGYPHLRQVNWLKTVEPVRASQGALYEIGSAMSFFQVKNYAEEWSTFLSGDHTAHPTNNEGKEDPTVGIVAAEIERLTRDFVLKQLSQELKGHPFAAFVAHLLEAMGFRARVSPEGPDGGIDVIAHRDELGFEPPIVKTQVKSGSGNVGQPEVSALLGTLSSGEFGLVVTLGGFTPQARSFARNKANLRLIDGEDLVDLVLVHYEQFDPRYKGLLPLKRVYVPEPIEGSEGE